MIELLNVSKIYKNETVALDNISLNIGEGVFGLLGRNGAGKTTLLRILTTIIKPTKGEVNILGNVGYMPQEFGFYKEFVAWLWQNTYCYFFYSYNWGYRTHMY